MYNGTRKIDPTHSKGIRRRGSSRPDVLLGSTSACGRLAAGRGAEELQVTWGNVIVCAFPVQVCARVRVAEF